MIFLDSSFLVSVEVETDQNHEKALKLIDEIIEGKFGKTIISDYIFDETVTVTFGRTKNLKKTILVGMVLKNSAEMLKIDEKDFEEAWNMFKKQSTTKFSFTDCTTVVVMKDKEIKNIATFDEDFKKVKEINVIGI
ncbi:MAG: PIN domain-containing protein [Candidatus Aenigmatarchaeota archaeon]